MIATIVESVRYAIIDGLGFNTPGDFPDFDDRLFLLSFDALSEAPHRDGLL